MMELVRKVILIFAIVLPLFVEVQGHGGEDHVESVAQTSSAGETITHLARTGDFELFFKHMPVTPDRATAADIFLSRYETNEPVGGARIEITFAGPSEAKVEAKPNDLAGRYGVELPPLARGEYRISARVEMDGRSSVVDLGTLDVAPVTMPEQMANERAALRATIILLISLMVILLVVILALFWRALSHRFKAEKEATAV
jgi:hypothetical protein